MLHKRGVGPKHLTRKRLNAKRLAAAMKQAVEQPTMAAAAAAIGNQMRAEDGVAAAVKLIESVRV